MESRFLEFLGACNTVILGVNERESPQLCHLPFIMDESGNFYVFASRFSSYFEALCEQKDARLLFINDNLGLHKFSGESCKIRCEIEPLDHNLDMVLMGFQAKYGTSILSFKRKQDFRLFCLKPTRGLYLRSNSEAFLIPPGQRLPLQKVMGIAS